MALPPTPSGVIRSRLIHEQPNADHVGSHFDLSYSGAAPDSTVLAAIASAVATAWETELKPFMTDSGLLHQVICIDLAHPDVPQGLVQPDSAGTRAGGTLPNNCAVVISDTIDRRYRGARPKRFLPFFTDGDLSSVTTWLTTSIDALDVAWSAFVDGLGGASFSGCVLGAPVAVSYFSGKHANPNPNGRLAFIPTPRAVPALFSVTAQSAQPRIASQRRRLTAA